MVGRPTRACFGFVLFLRISFSGTFVRVGHDLNLNDVGNVWLTCGVELEVCSLLRGCVWVVVLEY